MPRHGCERLGGKKPWRLEQTDAAVWHAVCQLLVQPARRAQAYRQRLHPHQQADARQGLETQIGKRRRGMARLIGRPATCANGGGGRRVRHVRVPGTGHLLHAGAPEILMETLLELNRC